MNWSLASIASALKLSVPQALCQLSVTAVITDTRHIVPGCLFVALKGPRFDGHDFIEQALEKGAAAALVERPVSSLLPQLVCADTRLGLGLLAR
ncbi:Mur ligase domain-containing protein, partial [Halomonas sp. 3D7M]